MNTLISMAIALILAANQPGIPPQLRIQALELANTALQLQSKPLEVAPNTLQVEVQTPFVDASAPQASCNGYSTDTSC